jgi:hypothetical protein
MTIVINGSVIIEKINNNQNDGSLNSYQTPNGPTRDSTITTKPILITTTTSLTTSSTSE